MKTSHCFVATLLLVCLNAKSQEKEVADLVNSPTPLYPIKWHPGHYGLSLKHYGLSRVNDIRADWARILNADTRFAGVIAFYGWYNLEPTKQNAYDFSPIDNDIAWLNKNFPGKKLIIEIWTRDFTRKTSLPTVPQNALEQHTKIPDYIISGNYTKSEGVAGATWNSNGRLAAFWHPPVLARLKALDAALAARYDQNPTVEVIKYDEYSIPAPSKGAPPLGWSQAKVINSWKSLYASMSYNWKRTNKVLRANWPNNIYGSPDTDIVRFAYNIKAGVGGPDILPPKEQNSPGETWGAKLTYGAGGAFGTTDYRGSIPIVHNVENPSWPMKVDDIESYAYSTLKATHISWLFNPLNMGTSSWKVGAGKTPWTTVSKYNSQNYPGVLDTLKLNNFRIHSACPKVYAQACKTQR